MGGFGAFGKMPALGDFFRIGAATELVTPWDRWVQQVLQAARATLGGRFDACYNSAPVWHFALAPSVAGAKGVVGVMMPSVDRVGRQFPLALFAQTSVQDEAPLRVLTRQAPVLAALEAVALDCLDDHMTREALQARLDPLVLRQAGMPSSIGTFGSALVLSGAEPEALCADLVLDLAGGQMRSTCAWAATIDGAARLILTPALPQPEVAHFLFDLADLSQTGAEL